jgi:DNA polymerase I-like protein with 3'-5' exonuclease and polymerase domains
MDLITLTHKIAMSLHRVGLAGAAINLPRFHKLGKEWQREAAKAKDLLVKSALRHGMKEFVPTNDGHIRQLLYEKLQYPIVERTEKDNVPKVDKQTITILLKQYPKDGDKQVLQRLLDFNSVDKLASTWYGRPEAKAGSRKSVSDLIHPTPTKSLGLLHNWINPLGARTGRRSSGGGEEGSPESRNSQNWPPLAKSVVGSRWPGQNIAICDFTRLEVVLMGWRAGDDKLLNYFLHGDGYIGVAKEFWGQTVKDGTPLYKATKSLVLGLNYNMGFYKLAHDLKNKAEFTFSNDWKTHVEKTKQARKKYLKMFPGLRNYIRERIAEVTDTQKVISPSGRVRHLPHHGPESEGFWHIKNSCVNFPIQSFASDVTGSALVDYEEQLLSTHGLTYNDWHSDLLEHPWDLRCSPVVNEVHDELDLDLHPKTGKKDLELLVDCMQNVRTLKKLVPDFKIKLKVDVKVKKVWE